WGQAKIDREHVCVTYAVPTRPELGRRLDPGIEGGSIRQRQDVHQLWEHLSYEPLDRHDVIFRNILVLDKRLERSLMKFAKLLHLEGCRAEIAHSRARRTASDRNRGAVGKIEAEALRILADEVVYRGTIDSEGLDRDEIDRVDVLV